MIIGIDATQSLTQYGAIGLNGARIHTINNHQRIEDLPILLADLMGDDAPTAVLTITGPGSYTGIRLALTAAKMISKVHQIPLIGVSLFDAYMQVNSPLIQSLTIVSSNSRKGILNVQLFQSNSDGFQAITSILQLNEAQFKAFLAKFEANVHWHHIGDVCRFELDVSDHIHDVSVQLSLQSLLQQYYNQPDLINASLDAIVVPIYSSPAVG